MRTLLLPWLWVVACGQPSAGPSIVDHESPHDTGQVPAWLDAGYDLAQLTPIESCDSLIALAGVDDLVVIVSLDVSHRVVDDALYACQPLDVSGAVSPSIRILAVVDGLTHGAPCQSVEERSYGPGARWVATSGTVTATLVPFIPAWSEPEQSCYPGNAAVACGNLALLLEDVVLEDATGTYAPLTAPRIELIVPYHTPDVPA